MKKTMAIVIGLLVLGLAFAAAQDKTQTQAQEKAQVRAQVQTGEGAQVQAKTRTKSEFRNRNRVAFVDENGDGVNDLARDADGDGIPNCQDPDWARPQDGSGYKGGAGKGTGTAAVTSAAGAGKAFRLDRDADGDGIPNGQDADWTRPQDGSGYKGQHKFAKGSFRTGATGAARMAGTGVCDGTGPKGGAQRKGRR